VPRSRADDTEAKYVVLETIAMIASTHAKPIPTLPEALRETIEDRPRAGGGLGGAALIPQQAAEARRRAHLP
jgi:hypothetical protein